MGSHTMRISHIQANKPEKTAKQYAERKKVEKLRERERNRCMTKQFPLSHLICKINDTANGKAMSRERES